MKKESTHSLLSSFEELDILNVAASGELKKETLSAAVDLTKEAYLTLNFTDMAKRIQQNVEKYTGA